jgi:hypothetical protein
MKKMSIKTNIGTLFLLLTMISVFHVREAYGQCMSTGQPSCQVYTNCFEHNCPCSGSDNYFTNYGLRYCQRFLAATGWSAEGQRWRDRTLICLQETIVPRLPIGAPQTCNCSAMKSFAYQSHVGCYTQTDASICNLPLGDIQRIWSIVDAGDLFDSYGLRQMLQVAGICLGAASNTLPEWNRVRNRINERLQAGAVQPERLANQLARLGFRVDLFATKN